MCTKVILPRTGWRLEFLITKHIATHTLWVILLESHLVYVHLHPISTPSCVDSRNVSLPCWFHLTIQWPNDQHRNWYSRRYLMFKNYRFNHSDELCVTRHRNDSRILGGDRKPDALCATPSSDWPLSKCSAQRGVRLVYKSRCSSHLL